MKLTLCQYYTMIMSCLFSSTGKRDIVVWQMLLVQFIVSSDHLLGPHLCTMELQPYAIIIFALQANFFMHQIVMFKITNVCSVQVPGP